MANPFRVGDKPLPAWAVKWMMTFFPPLWVNNVYPAYIAPDYRRARITIRRGLLNRNLQGTLWGGAYLSAADPWYGILLWLALKKDGLDVHVFSQFLHGEFKKQGRGTLTIHIELTDAVIAEAKAVLATEGKWVKPFEVEAIDAQGEVCFRATVTMNLRTPGYTSPKPGLAEPPAAAGLPL